MTQETLFDLIDGMGCFTGDLPESCPDQEGAGDMVCLPFALVGGATTVGPPTHLPASALVGERRRRVPGGGPQS
jgi:hypothetical protein